MFEQKIAIMTPHIPPYYSGAGKRALTQAKYLAGRGCKIVFISVIENNEDIKNIEMVTVKLPAVYEKSSLGGAICRNTYHPILFFKMLNIIAGKRVKLLHCIPAFSWPTFSAVMAAKILGISIITETTLEGSDDPLTILKSKVGKLKFLIFKFSDAIVNISPLLVSKSEEAGINGQKLHLIPNSVNTDQYVPPGKEEKKELRKSFGLSKFQYVFIYVGIMSPRKGVAELIEAFKTVKSEIDSCCLVLAGPIDKNDENKNYYRELKKQVEAEGLSDSVLFTGEVDNIESWLKAGDIFLFASKREGLPNVVLEAMSTGLPVVALRIPQTIEYIFNRESGIVVDNMKEFSRAMKQLLHDKNHYQHLSHNARNRVLNVFSDEVVMEQYLKLYEDLLKT